MIIFFSAGQLGNQVFQYQFINKIDNNEKIITSFCEYFNYFNYDKKRYVFINKYFRFFLRRILKLLANLRIITYLKQDKVMVNGMEVYSDTYSYKKGILSSIKLFEGFFQSQKFINSKIALNEQYLQKAKEYMSDIPSNNEIVFIHVRRGDYLDWSVLGKKNPTLPLEYYKKQINWFLEKYENPFFIFLSNDPQFIEVNFSYLTNKKISQNSVGVDLAIMQICNNAILSNSTLSWWGAYLMKSKKKIFAPKFWLGWQSKKWYPIDIQLDCIEYVDILNLKGS